MNNPVLSPNQFPGAAWQSFGELRLPLDAGADHHIRAWLVDALDPLNLTACLLEKITTSAGLAAERLLDASNRKHFDHVHLVIFTSARRPSLGQTWGFFRIEKLEGLSEEKPVPDHAIEFYLYVEGK